MQHNLYLRRILPCRFVHFAAGGYSHRKVRSAWSCTALKQSAQVLFPVFLACAAKLPILPAALSCIWRVIKYRLPELLRRAAEFTFWRFLFQVLICHEFCHEHKKSG